jgi:sulfate adenylyltransferase
MRLPSGLVWPIPITLDVTRDFASSVKEGDRIALRDPEGVLIATMEISDIWEPDKALEARSIFGTDDPHHPGVYFLQHRAGPMYLGGRLRGVEPPMHYDFKLLRDSPSELRGRFRKLGWRKVVRSRRAIRCIAHTRSSRCAQRVRRRQTCCCILSSA